MLGAYALTVLTLMGIWSIVALGLNIITGYAGQFNLGIGVYMGTGAYATAMLTTGAGFDFWLALPCALTVSATMGFLTGLPALRVREDALAVLTIGLVFVFESLLVYLPYFGGPVGIGRISPATINGAPLGKEAYLALVLVALLLVIAVTLYLKRAWIGLAWASIRESELAANVIGIHPARFKLYAFAVGATFAGLGGVLYAHFIRYITPYDFGFLTSIYVLTMIVFGGVGTIRGAVLGACVLTLLPELFRFVQDYRNLIYGATLIALMLYEPRGVLGDGSFVWRWVLAQWARLALAGRKPGDARKPGHRRRRRGAVHEVGCRGFAHALAGEPAPDPRSQQTLRRPCRRERREHRGLSARNLRCHRAQRRRQDHVLQSAQRDHLVLQRRDQIQGRRDW